MVTVISDREWLDEDFEMMKKIPPEEKRLASFWIRRSNPSLFEVLPIIIGCISCILFWGGRGRKPIIDLGIEGRVVSLIFLLLMIGLVYFLTRKQKGHVDIYPEMLVFYDYDYYTKEARPSHFYYWTDIVQYHWEKPYLWIGSKDSEPVPAWIGMCELRPYLEQYAPHAEVVRFNMKRYFEERRK